MFTVEDEYGIFTVYGVKEDEKGATWFLLYDTHGWSWSEARHYTPQTDLNEMEEQL